MITTIKAKLLAKRDDMYTSLVFDNIIEPENSWNKYFTVTLLPNWQTLPPKVGEEGFLTFESAKAGDKYYKIDSDTWNTYKQDGQYFITFTPNNINQSINEYKF